MLTIDFEASCLPRDGRSFPIEVALAAPSGWSRTWLIRPASSWSGWTWAAEAEALHGIESATLERVGQEPAAVMHALNAIAGKRAIVADHDLDRLWLATLSDAAAVAPTFSIRHVADILDKHRRESITRAVAAADHAVPMRHRAGPDARWLATLLDQLPPADAAMFNWARAPGTPYATSAG